MIGSKYRKFPAIVVVILLSLLWLLRNNNYIAEDTNIDVPPERKEVGKFSRDSNNDVFPERKEVAKFSEEEQIWQDNLHLVDHYVWLTKDYCIKRLEDNRRRFAHSMDTIVLKKDLIKMFTSPPRILVTYHYSEPKNTDARTLRHKRRNLAYFIEKAILTSPMSNIDFHLTISGRLPSLEEFYKYIEAEIPPRDTLIPQQDNVFVEIFGNLAPHDLCYHGKILNMVNSTEYDYFYMLNDSTRGPFVKSRDPIFPKHLEIPIWIDTQLFNMKKLDVKAYGSLFSCSRRPHLQSWAFIFHKSVKDIFIKRYSKSCKLKKIPAILSGEDGPFVELIERGHKFSSSSQSLTFDIVSNACLDRFREGVYENYSKCKNPFKEGIKIDPFRDIFCKSWWLCRRFDRITPQRVSLYDRKGNL